MKPSLIIALLCGAAVCAVGVAQEVSIPAVREKAVADLGRLVAPASGKELPKPALDPFSPPESHLRDVVVTGKAGAGQARTDDELIQELAKAVQPTGMMMLGGEPSLLFTERRQKIGDKVAVQLDGVEYAVEIVSIANNRFRIRYNDKEAERTIK